MEIVDVEFETIQHNKILALPMPRHELMKDKATDFYKQKQKEIELNEKLGLANQTILDTHQIVRDDINILTQSNNYICVNEKQLGEIFEMKKLKRMAHQKTFSSFMSAFKLMWINTLIFLPFLFSAMSVSAKVVTVFLWVATTAGVMLPLSFNRHNGRRGGTIEWDVYSVDLKTENVENTEIHIPYGAKLKLLEAKETKIFNRFTISYPRLRVTGSTIALPDPDPAITGHTMDGRMFMVVYWDLKRDVEKITSKLQDLKKFKLK
jgi:hypothetical protein